ncbi:MAG: sensor histidine kinase N-terminal domain-containing protein [Rhodobacter sp.]|nr:sensor histidine kinase N-terminal domain-containing protein [Paracoccaceae bacterium]MCC0077556.1 sensor histidine kinase N-terminal domain-containing protein [Rhodobacter sp.]
MSEAPPGRAASLSLTARLALGITALLLVGGVTLAIAAFAYGRTAAREAFDRLLVGAANDIASTVSVENGRIVVDLPVSAFQLLALAADDRIAYQVRDIDGSVLTGHTDLPQPPRDAQFYDADFRGEPARYLRVTRRFAERAVSGGVDVIVGQTLRARTELAYDITRKALYGLAIGGIAMLALAVVVVRSALRPLDRLARQLAGRDPQDLTPLQTAAPREVEPLVRSVNSFMGRLDRQFETMRNLISDTAHQLRTPVAALRAQTDLALSETDPARRDRILDRIHKRSLSLGRLLDQMLSHALVVHRSGSARREPVDLRDIALDIVESGDHAAVAAGRRVNLDIGTDPVTVLADPLSLREAASNLLSNAFAHGTPPVTIGASIEGGAYLLWIRDAGDGPPAALRAAIGQRFLRSAAASGQTSGLGLSISKSVAEAYGGQLRLENRPDGFRVALVLPPEEGQP